MQSMIHGLKEVRTLRMPAKRNLQAKKRLAWTSVVTALLVIVTLGGSAEHATAQSITYSFKTLDYSGATITLANGNNNNSEVVGAYVDSTGTHGYLYSGGIFQTLPNPNFPGAGGVDPSGINDKGQIVGGYQTQGFTPCGNPSIQVHSFLYSGGSFINIDLPNAWYTGASGINNSGVIVGHYELNVCGGPQFAQFISFPVSCGSYPYSQGASGINNLGQIVIGPGSISASGFLYPSCAPIPTRLGSQTVAVSINDPGQIAGYFVDSLGFHGFVLNGGAFTTLDFPGAIATYASHINNRGEIVGDYQAADLSFHGFIATPSSAQLIDPVPSLLGALANQNLSGLASGGNVVQGVAADGVSEVLVRMPAANVGDQFTLTLLDDQGQFSSSSSEDGGLGVIGQQNFSSQVTTNAVSTPSGTMAFALYLAPIDFPRASHPTITCGGVTGTDPQLACRFVTIQVQGPSGSPTPLPVTILRPPVVLIHGLWDDSSVWNNFAPLFSKGTADPRFSVGRVSYGSFIGNQISGTSPGYPTVPISFWAQANSLGFQYNAPGVLGQTQYWIQQFRQGDNPGRIPVAAVQADIVAHSMGGDITRILPLQQGFLSSNTFGQGPIHKIITIDTPHLGTPLAAQLLSNSNSCVRDELAYFGDITFDSVSLGGRIVSGAVGDLQGDGFGGSMSQALQDIAAPGPHPLPTALIAGVMAQFNLDNLVSSIPTLAEVAIIATCAALPRLLLRPPDPLAVNLTPSGWPTVFNGQPSDAIVPLASQLNSPALSNGFQAPGFVHSDGAETLGFGGPSVLPTTNDLQIFSSTVVRSIPNQVINLLNTPVTNQTVFNLLNP